ncbi:MAG: hypothetical protein IPJ37_02995 [Bacteroidales bacterium]|nr:hypothetical protein [Bacteroidales bacterium]
MTQTTSGIISGTIPANTTTGSGYRIRVISSTPAVTGSDNGIDLIVNALPVPTIGSNSPICETSDLILSSGPDGETSYSWTGPNSFASLLQNPTITSAPLAASGTYIVTVTDANGCSATAQTVVAVQTGLTLDDSNVYSDSPVTAPLCEGSTLHLFAPSGGTSYVWYGPDFVTVISTDQNPIIPNAPLSAQGEYNVVILNECNPTTGYSWPTTVALNPRPLPTIVGNATVCNNSTGNIYTTESGMTNYVWTVIGGTYSGGTISDNTITITWTTPGLQSVSVNYTDANGCTAVLDTQFPVRVNTNPVITGQPFPAIMSYCQNDIATTLSVTSAGATDYQWYSNGSQSNSGGTPIAGAISGSYTPLTTTPGTTYYYCVVTNASNCTTTSNVSGSVIVSSAIADNTVSSQPSVCSNTAPATITGSQPTGGAGIGNYTFNWESSIDGTTFINATGVRNLLDYSPGPLTVPTWFRRTVTSGGCTDISPAVQITIDPLPAATTVTGGGTFCASATITASGGAGGTIYFQGTTSNGTAIDLGGSSQTITTVGTFTYYFRSQSAAGCWGPQGSVTVTIQPAIVNVISSPQVICSGFTPVTLTGVPTGGSGGGYTYNWESSTISASAGFGNAAGTRNQQNYSPAALSQTTWYRRTVSSGVCINNISSPIEITVNALPAAVNVTGGGTVCINTTLNASNGGDGTIYFQGTTSGGTSTATPSTSQVISTPGTYYFRAQSAAGCWGGRKCGSFN